MRSCREMGHVKLSALIVFKEALLKAINQPESAPLEKYFGDGKEKEETSTAFQLHLRFFHNSKFIQSLKHRFLYVSVEEYDELNTAIDEGKEETGIFKDKQMEEHWSERCELSESNCRSASEGIGCFDL